MSQKIVEPKLVVIEGGPRSGKTTISHLVLQQFPNMFLEMPEVATMLLNGGFPLPGRDLEWTPEWQVNFQDAVVGVQRPLEAVFLDMARERGVPFVLCDRGIVGAAAYLPGGLKEFVARYHVDLMAELARYRAVFLLTPPHLEDRTLYEAGQRANNGVRFEPYERAVELARASELAWKDHPRLTVVKSFPDVADKIRAVVSAVAQLVDAYHRAA